MVNLTIIGSIVATTLLLSGAGYYLWSTRLQDDLFYGEPSILKIPESEMSQIERNFKNAGGFIKYPQSWNYKSYSTPYNGKCKQRPYVVFMAGSYENAQQALKAFKTYGQQFTIMGGGHDFECVSIGKGALLNLGLLDKVSPDYNTGIMTVQAGARWRDVYAHVFDTGFELMGGMCPSVGVSGFLLGGGFNWKLSPYYGSGAQNVVEMTAVLEDGSMVSLTRDNEYKELMWGMLGAGGMNFGLALEFKIKMHSYPQLKYNWMLMGINFSEYNKDLPGLSEMVQAVKDWVAFFDARRPEDGYGGNSVLIMRSGLARDFTVVIQGVCRECNWTEQIKEIKANHPPSFTYYMDEKMSWGEYETKYPVGTQTTPYWVSNPGIFLKDFPEDAVEKMVMRYLNEQLFIETFEITTFEGSVKDKEYTSFAYPQAKWKLAGGLGVPEQYADEQQYHVSGWKNLVKEEARRNYLGEYINYIDFNTDNYQKDYFGNNLKKLKKIKDKYDPENFFNRPFGIPPSK